MTFKRARTEEQVDLRLKSIRKTAAALYDTKGIAGVTFAQVAAIAGLTRPALYSYFDNRYDLIFDLLTEEFRILNSALKARLNALETDEPSADLLARTLSSEISAHRRFASLLVLCIGTFNQVSEKMVEKFKECSTEFSALLVSHLQRLKFRISRIEADKYAAAVYSAVLGTCASYYGEAIIKSECFASEDSMSEYPDYEEDLFFMIGLLTSGLLIKNRKQPTIKQAFSKVLDLDSFL
ncbi:MAG: TetR/AcrR family transcriptional regulator [Succinivibrio sp.]|nr:TetR/AcrR family transcriptional regulator [Succinivibrio sp.]